ncbi:MAG: hypothetical protein UT94_C0055G0004 [Candidatus Uhrbacteria bacterium GW2011_GWF2_40_263]|nr:MAG: hypothetical protein UT94_C0055G0004 [Candidatus Uhrbacteria bacterium GW2011_GWF2_40_263]
MGEQPITCALHEDRLKKIESSLRVLLERGNDFTVPVINGKTEHRKASELIGELYVDMKKLKEQRETPGKVWQKLGNLLLPLLNLLTIIGILIALFHKQ